MVLASVLLGISLLPLREDASTPVVLNMMFMLWHVFINYEDLSSAPYSYTMMNANFLSLFLNIVTIKFSASRGGRLLMDGNPKGCEVAEHIATKFELNPWMISTFKNEKFI